MSEKKQGRGKEQEGQATPSGEWQAEDVTKLLANPIYGYGKLLQPSDMVVDHVQQLNRDLAERQKSLGRALTLDELDAEYTALMDWLVAQGICWHEQDVPLLITKEKWLRAQQITIQRLVDGEAVGGNEMVSLGETPEFDEDIEEEWGCYEGQCQACDLWGRVDDLGLCAGCRIKLERDLVRQRDWDYSAWAFGLSDEGREELYRQLIAQHGKALEFLEPQEGKHKKRSRQKRRRRK